ALSAAKLALGGSRKIAEAGRMMRAFADARTKSYHYYQASEIVGDLLVAIRQYAAAGEYYARLDKAPWPDYKMRAAVASARVLLDEGKATEAIEAFDKILAVNAEGDAAPRQQKAAKVGKAAALVALKKPDDAVKLIDEVIEATDTDAKSEEAPLAARAYNVLGAAHRQAGRTQEALLAFLHVDLLYPNVPDAHAEALANLAGLWEQVHKAERASRARQTLKDQYPESPWTKKSP
ncbi:MAG: tetratricopeptide repeat protein, partial [Thermoguttaceae bacterium]